MRKPDLVTDAPANMTMSTPASWNANVTMTMTTSATLNTTLDVKVSRVARTRWEARGWWAPPASSFPPWWGGEIPLPASSYLYPPSSFVPRTRIAESHFYLHHLHMFLCWTKQQGHQWQGFPVGTQYHGCPGVSRSCDIAASLLIYVVTFKV